jgi:mitochondrial fission protein ELM1
MAFLIQRFVQSALRSPAAVRKSQLWERPDLVTLPVRAGLTPSDKPPVRIFLGTQPAQYKAERVFIWSIEKQRDPARVYEIYLMKNLRGFKSKFWLTGFTNYRFAIPHFAGGKGRAIYNDVDQIYLKDPALLFDLPMGDHGYLSIDPGDISVALLDCEKMLGLWSFDDACSVGKNTLLARAMNSAGLWGKLDGGWNARDNEYVAGESGVLHYTALHRQPWHPFPSLFVYQKNPHGGLWDELEREANEACFQVFSARHSSQGFAALRAGMTGRRGAALPAEESRPSGNGGDAAELAGLLQESSVQSLLHCRITGFTSGAWVPVTGDMISVHHLDPLTEPFTQDPSQRFDAVVCTDTLEIMPDDDVPWLLDQLFRRARRLVACTVVELPDSAGAMYSQPWQRSAEWWHYQFHTVARRHPGVRWHLHLTSRRLAGLGKPLVLGGNESAQRDFRVWVINSRKLGHSSQSNALAEMLGWPYQKLQVEQDFNNLARVLLHLGMGQLGPCRAPWPDVVIGCGWWSTHVARWIKARSGGRSRLLLAGRKSRGIKSTADIVVCCEHFHLPAHRRRIETLLPVHPLTSHGLEAARQRGEALFGAAARPWVALLVGGDSKQHMLPPPDAAEMGRRVLEQVSQLGGSLFAVTSRRTSSEAAKALNDAFQGRAKLYVWAPGARDNPYLEYLAAADLLVVSGESESMLTDALATAKPVFIYALRKRRLEPPMALGQWLLQRCSEKPRNRRGTERPQQGFEYLCARLLHLEWILPPRDLEGLHQRIVERGYAAHFADSLQVTADRPVYRQEELGERLRIMLDQPPTALARHGGAGEPHPDGQ